MILGTKSPQPAADAAGSAARRISESDVAFGIQLYEFPKFCCLRLFV